MSYEERLARLEVEVRVLKRLRQGDIAAGAFMLEVVKATIDRMEAFRQDKQSQIDDGSGDDYADVISTLPMLREALERVQGEAEARVPPRKVRE